MGASRGAKGWSKDFFISSVVRTAATEKTRWLRRSLMRRATSTEQQSSAGTFPLSAPAPQAAASLTNWNHWAEGSGNIGCFTASPPFLRTASSLGAGVTLDSKGNVYGTTLYSGTSGGTVFESRPAGRQLEGEDPL